MPLFGIICGLFQTPPAASIVQLNKNAACILDSRRVTINAPAGGGSSSPAPTSSSTKGSGSNSNARGPAASDNGKGKGAASGGLNKNPQSASAKGASPPAKGSPQPSKFMSELRGIFGGKGVKSTLSQPQGRLSAANLQKGLSQVGRLGSELGLKGLGVGRSLLSSPAGRTIASALGLGRGDAHSARAASAPGTPTSRFSETLSRLGLIGSVGAKALGLGPVGAAIGIGSSLARSAPAHALANALGFHGNKATPTGSSIGSSRLTGGGASAWHAAATGPGAGLSSPGLGGAAISHTAPTGPGAGLRSPSLGGSAAATHAGPTGPGAGLSSSMIGGSTVASAGPGAGLSSAMIGNSGVTLPAAASNGHGATTGVSTPTHAAPVSSPTPTPPPTSPPTIPAAPGTFDSTSAQNLHNALLAALNSVAVTPNLGAGPKTRSENGVSKMDPADASAAIARMSENRVKALDPTFQEAEKVTGVPPVIGEAIASRETHAGGPHMLNPATGMSLDAANKGYGIMQEDQKAHPGTALGPQGIASPEHIERAEDIFANGWNAIQKQFPNWTPAQQLQAAFDRYNGGKSTNLQNLDAGSTGRDYGGDSTVAAKTFEKDGLSQ